jgi:hypothetical protein
LVATSSLTTASSDLIAWYSLHEEKRGNKRSM